MTTGPVLVMALEGDNAILKNRDIMGLPILKKLPQGLFVQNLQKLSTKMQFTVLIAPRTQRSKLHFSSALQNFAHEPVKPPRRWYYEKIDVHVSDVKLVYVGS